MDKKRILLIVNSLALGGIEKRIYNTLRHFDKNKYEFKICCLFERGFFADDIERMNIPVRTINANLNKRLDFKALFKLVEIIRKEKPDIVRTYSIYSNRYGNLAAMLAGAKKVISSYHNIYIENKSKKAYLFDSICLLKCNTLIVSSEIMKQFCLSRFKINPNKIKIIPNSINLKEITAYSADTRLNLKKSLGIEADDFVLISIGRLESAKGYHFLIDAVEEAKKIIPNIKLILIGDGSLKKHLNYLVQNKNLNNNILFLGQSIEIYKFLAIADLYVLPSLFEGFPTVLLEAMAMKLPILATEVGISRWLLTQKDYESGLIVPPKNALAISGAIVELYHDPRRREIMGSKGRLRVENEFTIDRENKQLEDLFNQN